MTAESKSCHQSDFWKETASRSPGWLETSFRLLMGTCRRQMIGVGLGGEGGWQGWIPEAGNGQRSSQAGDLLQGDPKVKKLGFKVEI